jgi:predicted metal-dependent phosphoesterase TrpH
MTYKIDLHSHSIISYDGGITAEEYMRLLDNKIIDHIAITDHNETKFAKELAKKLGDKIIIGEEITSKDGEIIGLFLQETIPQGLTARQTVKQIHEQGALVYIPHPFEIFRHGLKIDILEQIKNEIDIIEVFNARSKWRGKSSAALKFAEKYKIATAASSDAHGQKGLGTSFSIISETPYAKTLPGLLKKGKLCKQFAPIITYLYPSINKIKHKYLLTRLS